MKEDPGVSNAQAWGCPSAPPINIQGDSSVKAWGCPRCIPFFINNHRSVFRCTMFLSLRALCALLGASCSLLSLGLFCFLCCSNKSDPCSLFRVGEEHAPLELELLIGFACLFF